jgi:4-hydroxy-3-polyprenylbenzoate decarboxylase
MKSPKNGGPAEPQTEALRDLRSTIAFLHKEGDIIESDAPVNPDLEITGIQKHLDGSCPLLFNNVVGKPNHRVITNLFGDYGIMHKLYGWKDGAERTAAIARAFRNPLPPVVIACDRKAQ